MSDEGAVLHMLHCHFVFLSFLSAGIDVASPSNFIALLLLFLFFFVSLFNIPLAAVCVFLSSITKTKNKFSASRFIELQRAASFFSVLVSLSLSFFFLLALLYSLFTKGNNVVYSSLSRAQTRVSVKSNKEKKTVTIHRSASLRFAFALFFFFPSHLPFCLLAHPLLCFFFFWLFFPL